MGLPRRSTPLPGKRIAPSRAPCGMLGSDTLSSPDLGPFGAVVRSQISQNMFAPFMIFVPSFCNMAEIPAFNSDGGGPGGADVYCRNAAPAAMMRDRTSLVIYVLQEREHRFIQSLVGKRRKIHTSMQTPALHVFHAVLLLDAG